MFWEEEEANRGHEDVEVRGSTGNGEGFGSMGEGVVRVTRAEAEALTT